MSSGNLFIESVQEVLETLVSIKFNYFITIYLEGTKMYVKNEKKYDHFIVNT